VAQGLYRSVEEIGVKWLDTGDDSLLRVGICCVLLAIQLLLEGSKEMEITVPRIANWNFEWLRGYGQDLKDDCPYSLDLAFIT